MLRIHIETAPDGMTLRLEGKLIQPWVDELVRVWAELAHRRTGAWILRIDLEAVSFVDAQGRSILGALRRLGCQLEGSGPYISAVIDEISSNARR